MKLDVVYSQAKDSSPIFRPEEKVDLAVYHSDLRFDRMLGAQNVMAKPTTVRLKVSSVKPFDLATSANKLIKPHNTELTSLLGAATEIDKAEAETSNAQTQQLYKVHFSALSVLKASLKAFSLDVVIALRRYVNAHGGKYEGRIR